MKKSLADYRTEYFEASGKVSEINRSMGLAAVAIVWTFTKTTKAGDLSISWWLKYALLFVVIGLVTDLLQYIWRTLSIAVFYRIREKQFDAIRDPYKRDQLSSDVHFPTALKNITWWFFAIKLACMIIGYIFIACYIVDRLKY